MPTVDLVTPDSPERWAIARRLVEEYAASLKLDLGFQKFDRELAMMETEYGPPDGCVLLAGQDGDFIGCGGLRRSSAAACEMKRLYVQPGRAGAGAGRALAEALIARAKALGYASMRLDTLPSMSRAQRLYASLGFKPTAPYRYNPIEGTSFLELQLR
jgi:GNAT superfamily N-acetyltransferase